LALCAFGVIAVVSSINPVAAHPSSAHRACDQDRAKSALDLAVFLLPGIGALAYLVVEILPSFSAAEPRAAPRPALGTCSIPTAICGRASAEVEISGNVDARRRLGDELYERNQYDEAIEVYRGGLKGIFEHDPTLLLAWRGRNSATGLCGRARDAGALGAAESGLQVSGCEVAVCPHA